METTPSQKKSSVWLYVFLFSYSTLLLYCNFFFISVCARTQASVSCATLNQSSLVAHLAAGGYDLSGDSLGLFFSRVDHWRMTNPLFKGPRARLKTSGAVEINCRCRGDASGFQANCRQSLIGDKSVCNVAKEMQLPAVLPKRRKFPRGSDVPAKEASVCPCQAHWRPAPHAHSTNMATRAGDRTTDCLFENNLT